MKGYVYIIRSFKTDGVYYGSTSQMLCKRMATHRQDYKKWLRDTHDYMTSFEILKYDDAYIELVEEVEYENKQHLYAREGHHIRNNECVNKCVMGRTWQERREENKEEWGKYMKQWKGDNKEKIKAYRKKYNEEHKQEISDYREANKEALAETARLYREANKEAISARRKEARLKKKATS